MQPDFSLRPPPKRIPALSFSRYLNNKMAVSVSGFSKNRCWPAGKFPPDIPFALAALI